MHLSRLRAHGALNALAVIALLAYASGCDESAKKRLPPETAAALAPLQVDGAELYASRCAACHGSAGRANGVAAASLRVPPRDLADPVWQRATTDAELASVIVGGGAAVNRSAAMPANPDLAADPETLRALIAHLRALAAK